MNIQKINLFTPNNKVRLKEHSNQTAPQMKASNLPMMAYKDYNISFGERLFRTPANFFEQDFNRNNMPVTMKRYLFADYEDRQNMPPNQMLKLVFDDINLAKNMDEVKYLYPDEPLFENLSDKPKVKARTGIISEIEMMKEDGKTLFKNGQDNLGFYILKKIYLEGKSLKEINNDFKKDVSIYYNGLSPIQYETLAAYGIKFPKNAFWKSFTATREDFPYEYKPRKPIEERTTGFHTNHAPATAPKKPEKKFQNIQEWQVDKLTNAMIEGNGSTEQTRRSLKKNSAGDVEALNFVAKYMGEINSVVLEKLHVSEEMKDFFENYENLSDSQKVKFKKYWENPDIKELRSLVMSSTIRFFLDVYGVDGNNDEFKELIEYAHSIKPNRVKAQEEHNKLQAEYEEIFKDYNPEFFNNEKQSIKEEFEPLEKTEEELYRNQVEQTAKEHNAQIYTYELSSGTKISIVSNYQDMIKRKVAQDMKFFPQSYKDDYSKYLYKQGLKIPKYLVSLFYNVEGLTEIPTVHTYNKDDKDKETEFELFKKEHLMSSEEVNTISTKLTAEYNDKRNIQYRAVDQILNDLLFSIRPTKERIEQLTKDSEKIIKNDHPNLSSEEIHKFAIKHVRRIAQQYTGKHIATLQINQIHDGLELLGADETILRPEIERRFAIYNKPLSQKERQEITKKVIEYICKYSASTGILDNQRSRNIMQAISDNLNKYPQLKDALIKTLNNYQVIPSSNGDYRAFLMPDANKEMLEAKAEIFIAKYLNEHPDAMFPLIAMDKDSMKKYIAPVDMNLYNSLVQFRIFQQYT